MKFFTSILFLICIFQTTFTFCQEIQYVNMEAKSKWNQDVDGITRIPVFWENASNSNSVQRQWVKEAIESTWEKYANIDFTGWGNYDNSGRGIRIFICDTSHPHCKGVGTMLNGAYEGMVLNFVFAGKFQCLGHTIEQCIKYIAIHEFGHALGIAHEQDRADCECNEHPPDHLSVYGGHYVTPCDQFSVMNYCNPRWNNNGQLSSYDIQGIQAVYGAKISKMDWDQHTGLSYAVDKLGPNQVWENLYFTIGNQQFIYNINQNNKEEIKSFKFSASAVYSYKVSSVSYHTDGKTYFGSGEGTIYIDSSKNYKIDILSKTNSYPNYELYIVATEIKTAPVVAIKEPITDPEKPYWIDKRYEMFYRNGKKPIGLVLLTTAPNEKFYYYEDGVIMVFNKSNNTFFECCRALSPSYKDWNGKIWSWAFHRNVGGRIEPYTVSNLGEIWSMSMNGEFMQYGKASVVDF